MVTDKQLIYKNEARVAVLYENPSIVHCIDRLKVVDAVEVVRCKDCIYGELDDEGWYLCTHHGSDWNEENHFCSYGERKMDNV